ncbi:hypothetical protein HMPREF9104_00698 [Lentilactobacillus kisonensis F0435]|uniref:Uncharacterized protein n=1 Tax=Lentilactobacillus kisonensis F0435 TaxID=797516 RepID=H1LDM3_9LACO|nr:hypothetical protein HMPREF9104_00698 [Lentilactobacillus kisonensis F0435]
MDNNLTQILNYKCMRSVASNPARLILSKLQKSLTVVTAI